MRRRRSTVRCAVATAGLVAVVLVACPCAGALGASQRTSHPCHRHDDGSPNGATPARPCCSPAVLTDARMPLGPTAAAYHGAAVAVAVVGVASVSGDLATRRPLISLARPPGRTYLRLRRLLL
jgi:hypothetical protein